MLGPEKIFQGTENYSYELATADWTNRMRSKHLHSSRNLDKWLVLSTQRDQRMADAFVRCMNMVCPSMGIQLSRPEMVHIESDRVNYWVKALRSVLEHREPPHFVVVILPGNKKDRYDAIKTVCCLEYPVPSQVILAKNIANEKRVMSVVTKIAIQINCKLGGEAWACEIPIKNTMVVGYDTYHDSAGKGLSVGAVVCSTNANLTTYHSGVAFQKTHQELLDGFGANFRSGLASYNRKNGRLPERVFVYRDGVGDGQLQQVRDYEIEQMRDVFRQCYGEQEARWPKLTFIVVNKRINTRLFARDSRGNFINPPPSTVVDDEITRPERWDFFLVSPSVRQGTVAPTQYVVLDDKSGLQPDHLQRLTYKLTHLYYNWPGTIRVPAPCQYSHKLAFLVGQSLHDPPADALADTLFYL